MRPQKVVCVFFSVCVLFDIFSAGKEKQQLVRLHRSSPTVVSELGPRETVCGSKHPTFLRFPPLHMLFFQDLDRGNI